jgi:hypothetical protein
MEIRQMPLSDARGAARCADHAELYQLLEEPPSPGAPAAVRRRHAEASARAEQICRSCPLFADCLYTAVVEHDVAGYVAGTDARQRERIRKLLAISVAPEDFDTLAGVTGRNRPVDHEEVIRLRNAYPQESLERLANRLGCSLSTVKRHLRRARAEHGQPAAAEPGAPSVGEVLSAARSVRGDGHRGHHAAA